MVQLISPAGEHYRKFSMQPMEKHLGKTVSLLSQKSVLFSLLYFFSPDVGVHRVDMYVNIEIISGLCNV